MISFREKPLFFCGFFYIAYVAKSKEYLELIGNFYTVLCSLHFLNHNLQATILSRNFCRHAIHKKFSNMEFVFFKKKTANKEGGNGENSQELFWFEKLFLFPLDFYSTKKHIEWPKALRRTLDKKWCLFIVSLEEIGTFPHNQKCWKKVKIWQVFLNFCPNTFRVLPSNFHKGSWSESFWKFSSPPVAPPPSGHSFPLWGYFQPSGRQCFTIQQGDLPGPAVLRTETDPPLLGSACNRQTPHSTGHTCKGTCPRPTRWCGWRRWWSITAKSCWSPSGRQKVVPSLEWSWEMM